MTEAATCPKCGAAVRETALYWTAFECNSSEPSALGITVGYGLEKFQQTDKCRISSLERDLHAAREEIAALKREHDWREDPTYPNWGDVKFKNISVITTQEILAAAKRLVAQGETLGGCGTPYGKHTGFAEQFDEIAVGEAYQKQAAELAERDEEIAGLRELLKTSKYIGHWTDAEINAALERRKGEG